MKIIYKKILVILVCVILFLTATLIWLATLDGQLQKTYIQNKSFAMLDRNGKIVFIPHYINKRGPRTLPDPHLKKLWHGFDLQNTLHKKLKMPILVLNDAEVHASAVISGVGLETVLTFGTGLGCAMFNNGKIAPHLELSHATVRYGKTIDAWIGEISRRRMGNQLWSRRVKALIGELYPMIIWDKLYIGGGNAQRISKSALKSFDYKVKIIPNSAGVAGGVKAWDLLG